MKRSAMATVGLLAVGLLTAATYMSVSFDLNTGTGWVGKGDVQAAYGWANKAMQQNHTSITFDYNQTTEYSWACEWTTGPDHNQTVHTQTREKTFAVSGVLGNTDRKTGQWTGWFLTGYTSGGPQGGNDDFTPSCPGNPNESGNSGEKVLVEGSLTVNVLAGGLYANFNGDRRLLSITI